MYILIGKRQYCIHYQPQKIILSLKTSISLPGPLWTRLEKQKKKVITV